MPALPLREGRQKLRSNFFGEGQTTNIRGFPLPEKSFGFFHPPSRGGWNTGGGYASFLFTNDSPTNPIPNAAQNQPNTSPILS
jgi:hypothetical protein